MVPFIIENDKKSVIIISYNLQPIKGFTVLNLASFSSDAKDFSKHAVSDYSTLSKRL